MRVRGVMSVMVVCISPYMALKIKNIFPSIGMAKKLSNPFDGQLNSIYTYRDLGSMMGETANVVDVHMDKLIA
jgi:hypothetical protein